MKHSALLRVLAFALACAAPFAVGPLQVSAADTGPIKVGVPIPLSGTFGVYGEQMKQATELAVGEINQSGGVLGRQLQPIYADEESEVQPAIDKVKQLIQSDNVDVLIGIISSASRDAVIPTVFRGKKVFIYPTTYEGGTAAKFSGKGSKYVFTTGPVSEQYIKPFIPWLIKNRGKSFYLLGMDYIYGTGSVANAKQYIAEAGGTVVGEEFVPLGTTDFAPILNRVIAAKPEVLFAVIAGDDLIYLLKQFKEFGLKQKGIAFATSELDESYMTGIGAEAVDGVTCSLPYFMGIDTPENKKFIANMRAKFGKDLLVSLAAESMYYSLYLFKAGAERAGSVETDALIKGLEGAEFQAPEGKVSIRAEDHQIIVNDAICEVKADTSLPPEKWINIVERHEVIAPSLQGKAE
jgi:urea transport system substrate-binding protein